MYPAHHYSMSGSCHVTTCKSRVLPVFISAQMIKSTRQEPGHQHDHQLYFWELTKEMLKFGTCWRKHMKHLLFKIFQQELFAYFFLTYTLFYWNFYMLVMLNKYSPNHTAYTLGCLIENEFNSCFWFCWYSSHFRNSMELQISNSKRNPNCPRVMIYQFNSTVLRLVCGKITYFVGWVVQPT